MIGLDNAFKAARKHCLVNNAYQATYQQEKFESKKIVIKVAKKDAQIVYIGFGDAVLGGLNPMASLFVRQIFSVQINTLRKIDRKFSVQTLEFELNDSIGLRA